jgi:hypothetical protein
MGPAPLLPLPLAGEGWGEGMTTAHILELAAAALLVAAGIWLMRRRAANGSRTGSQGGVILLLIGAMVAIHGLGLLEYRPSPSELEASR